MPFPVPDAAPSESADARRDERKREASPPSAFYAQSQAILTAVRYFEPLNSGYPGTAKKHKNRTRSALFVQLMATFEFAMKDFIARTLDHTHIYDEAATKWDWLDIDIPTLLGAREGSGRLGGLLVHPLSGWQTPDTMNSRYMDVFERQPIAGGEIETLQDLWIVRHSVAHNGGLVTSADARRLRSGALAEKQVLIDVSFLEQASDFLRGIVGRLEAVVGPSLLGAWFKRGASRLWADDEEYYISIKLLTTYIQSRARPLPAVTEQDYNSDLSIYG